MDRGAPHWFDEVVAATGVAPIIAKGIVRRALSSVGAEAQTAGPEDYVAAMPTLRAKLNAFIAPGQDERLDALEEKLRNVAGITAPKPHVIEGGRQAPASHLLRGMRGPHVHAVFVVETQAVIGRAPSADIQLLDQHVSREHARITVSVEDRVTLVDLRSNNGTFVQSEAIKSRVLRPGDRIRVGTAEYVYETSEDTAKTSEVFASRLTDHATLSDTITRRTADQILNSATVETPIPGAAAIQRPVGPHGTRETETVRGLSGHAKMGDTPTRETPIAPEGPTVKEVLELGRRSGKGTRLPCHIKVGEDGPDAKATLLGISTGGMSLSCPTLPTTVGDQVTIRIPVDGRTAVFRAQVLWVNPDLGTLGTRFDGSPAWEATG